MKSWTDIYKSQLNEARRALDSIDNEKVDQLLEVLHNNKNNIFFTGVGKNGHVASKASSSFSSMNIRSFFIDPVEALHGSMSLISNEDVVIAISKSGSTIELLQFLKNLRRKNSLCKIILVHSDPTAKCKEFCNFSVRVAIEHEKDKFNLVPISSIIAFTTFLQAVGVELSYRNNLTKDQFITNHPGGSIGATKI